MLRKRGEKSHDRNLGGISDLLTGCGMSVIVCLGGIAAIVCLGGMAAIVCLDWMAVIVCGGACHPRIEPGLLCPLLPVLTHIVVFKKKFLFMY